MLRQKTFLNNLFAELSRALEGHVKSVDPAPRIKARVNFLDSMVSYLLRERERDRRRRRKKLIGLTFGELVKVVFKVIVSRMLETHPFCKKLSSVGG